MASTFTTLGIEKMATGENAGTWGDKTNTNLEIVEKAIAGYVEKSIAGGAQTTTLTIQDGDSTESTSIARHAVIKLTGSITGNQVVTVPDSIEKVFIVTNGTSGAFTVQFKTVSGTGITFGVSEKTTKLFYSDGTNIVDAGFSGGTDLDGKELVLDADGDTSITADTDDQIDIKIGGTDQIKLVDGAIVPVTDNDIDLGTSSLEFKDAYFDGTVTSDAFAGPLTGDVTGNVSGTAATVTTAAQSNITSLGTLTTLTVDDITINGSTISDAGDFTLDVEGDIILDANGADVFLKDAGTTYGSLTNTSGNLIVKSGTTTALTFSGANVTVAGDLTVSGDDITMGTNTAGNILVADGTNFNSVAVSSFSEISTVANDDVFLAIDTSGGGLKKITRSAIVSGLAAGELSNIVEDTSPQLGANLDTNSHNILIDDDHFIGDENGNEQIVFQTTSSAVNQVEITNAATGNAPQINPTGDDTNISLNLTPKGSGKVVLDGNVSIDTGVIDLKNGGTASKVLFYCESSNAHAQTVQSAPHSVGATNTLTLPGGSTIGNDAATLVSDIGTQTLTNKTLTSPVLNTATVGTSIVPASADGATLGTASVEFSDLFLADGGTIQFGNDQEITLTHVADDGLILKHVGTGDGKEPSFSFHAGDNDIAADDVLGSIFFKAPDEGAGTDAVLVAAGIEAVSEGDFSASNNATKLSFLTGASEAAAEKMSLSSAGLLTISDDLVIKSGGTIGGAGDTDLLTLGSAILTVAGEISVTTLDIGGTNVTSTAAELNALDGITAVVGELNALDIGSTAVGTAVASKTTFDTYMSGASKIFSDNKSKYTWDVDPSDNTIIIVHTPAAGDVKYKVN